MMSITPEGWAVIGTLGGAVVGALTGVASTWISSRVQERHNFQELMARIAVEDWKTRVEHGDSAFLHPLEEHLLYAAEMADLSSEAHKLSEQEIRDRLKRVRRVCRILEESRAADSALP